MYDGLVRYPLLHTVVAIILTTFSLSAQAPANNKTASSYKPLEAFAPLALPDPVNVYRSSDGAPGPHYWQNRADYELHAAIDTMAKTLTCSELITYTNNSPDTLTSLWLHLEQNIYRKDSRSGAFASEFRRRRGPAITGSTNTDGYTLESIEIQPLSKAHQAAIKAAAVITDTRMQIQLPGY